MTTRGAQPVWRIAKHTAEYRADDMTGGGAKMTGGRWNAKGRAVVYAATTISLATLETLAHLGDNIAIRNAFLVRIDIPATLWRRRVIVAPDELDITWKAEPPGSTSITFGNAWLAKTDSPVLLVPSVIVPEEHNVLINPAHPAVAKVNAQVVRQYVYDPRL